jgi:uncharacterized protein YoxC
MTRALQIAGLVLLCAVLAPVACHIPGWCRGVDHLQEQAQNTADSVAQAAAKSNQASEEMFDASGIIVYQTLPRLNGLLDAVSKGTLPKVNALLTTANGTIAATGATVAKVGDVADTVKGKVAEVDVTADQKKALDLMDAVTGAVPHLNQAVDNFAEDADTLNVFIADPANAKLRAAATDFLISYAGLGKTVNTTTGHIDKRFFAPYDGNHPKWHEALSITTGLLGLGSKGAEASFYGIGAVHGQ